MDLAKPRGGKALPSKASEPNPTFAPNAGHPWTSKLREARLEALAPTPSESCSGQTVQSTRTDCGGRLHTLARPRPASVQSYEDIVPLTFSRHSAHPSASRASPSLGGPRLGLAVFTVRGRGSIGCNTAQPSADKLADERGSVMSSECIRVAWERHTEGTQAPELWRHAFFQHQHAYPKP